MIQYETISALSGPFLITPGNFSLEEAQSQAVQLPIRLTGYRFEEPDPNFNEIITLAECLDDDTQEGVLSFGQQFPRIIQHQDLAPAKIFAIEVVPDGIILYYAVENDVKRIKITRFGNKIRATIPSRPRRKSPRSAEANNASVHIPTLYHLTTFDFYSEYVNQLGPCVTVQEISSQTTRIYRIYWQNHFCPAAGVNLRVMHRIPLYE